MLTLVADRFVCRTLSRWSASRDGAQACPVTYFDGLDLATGQHGRLRLDPAGSRRDQQAWVESCTRAHSDGTLEDFGFVGEESRFEATAQVDACSRSLSFTEPTAVVEWLESPRPSSTRILRLRDHPDPRELRLHGFVPVALPLLADRELTNVWPLLEGRSVVLLDVGSAPAHLSLALLKLRRANVREVYALSRPVDAARTIENAAEGRARYELRLPIVDGRAGAMLAEGERLLKAGRHAGAERALRAAGAAFDRRSDTRRAADTEMMLGRLLLARGRASSARAMFESAHDRFQRAGAAIPAITAMVMLGMSETDLGLLGDAERSCRAAHSASAALTDAGVTALSTIGLARTLFWQERYGEARDVLDSVPPGSDPETCARYWCLVARLSILGNGFTDARRALAQARSAVPVCMPAIESLVRRWEAAVQARLGDAEAMAIHVRAGLAAARTAHLPLRALQLRLTLVEGLVQAGLLSRVRVVGARLRRVSQTSIPPLLKQQIERTLARVDGATDTVCLPPAPVRNVSTARVHESAAFFQAAGSIADLDGVREILSLSHQFENESEALTRAAASIRKHTHAISAGILGCANGNPQLFFSTGPKAGAAGATTRTGSAIAGRSYEAGISIGPEACAGGIEGAVPMRYLGRVIGAVALRWSRDGPEDAERAMAFCSAAAAACAPMVYVVLERRSAPARDDASFDLVGVSAPMEEVRRAVARAASAPFTVLIEGESGSGKELVARAIHRAGCRRERRFCAFNCAAMPEDLVDAELFGHAKGAFTGAAAERLGLFESADGGTVFLDEVGELSARAQAKVLRVLQEAEVRRIGENFARPFDARLVAATNRSLRAEADAGRFRQDLLYRLDVIRILVPPLRERVEDIPLLATRFWRQSAERIGSKAVLGQSAFAALARYDWPGNVRELQNVLTALVVAAPSRGMVGASHMPAAIARAVSPASHDSLETARLEFEQRFVRAALARAAGHRGHTAAALGLSRQGLAKLMHRLQLDV